MWGIIQREGRKGRSLINIFHKKGIKRVGRVKRVIVGGGGVYEAIKCIVLENGVNELDLSGE